MRQGKRPPPEIRQIHRKRTDEVDEADWTFPLPFWCRNETFTAKKRVFSASYNNINSQVRSNNGPLKSGCPCHPPKDMTRTVLPHLDPHRRSRSGQGGEPKTRAASGQSVSVKSQREQVLGQHCRIPDDQGSISMPPNQSASGATNVRHPGSLHNTA